MKKTIFFLSVFPLCILMIYHCSSNPNSPHSSSERSRMAMQTQDAALCDRSFSEIPNSIGLPEVQTIPGFKNQDSLINFLQHKADSFSWHTFMAMNWLADEMGNPDSTVCFGEDGTTVWEHWMPAAHIYRPNNEPPMEWRTGTAPDGDPLNSDHHKQLRFLAKNDDFTNITAEDAAVIDQEKMYTLYEIYYNRDAYDYVVNSGLNNKKGQESFVQNWPDFTSGMDVVLGNGDTLNIQDRFKRAYFPIGNLKDSTEVKGDTTYFFRLNRGAMIIKSAWRSLPEDEVDLYHARTVTLSGDSTVFLGLVGMHFIHKVAESTQWVWSTFEHVYNAPTLDSSDLLELEKGVDYAYFDEENLDTADFNKPEHRKFEWKIDERRPTQVVREKPIYDIAEDINAYFHEKIREINPKSVWLNYQLVGTQWPFETELFTSGGKYQPDRLANTVMETYKQPTSSCLECHSQARFMEGTSQSSTGFNADFVYTLNNAQ